MPKETVFFPWYQSHSWKPKTRNERCGQPLRIALPPGILPLSAISAEVFILLGLGVFLMRRAYSWPLIGWTLLSCLVGRALNLGVSQDSDETRESRPFLLWCRHFKRLKRRLGRRFVVLQLNSELNQGMCIHLLFSPTSFLPAPSCRSRTAFAIGKLAKVQKNDVEVLA